MHQLLEIGDNVGTGQGDAEAVSEDLWAVVFNVDHEQET